MITARYRVLTWDTYKNKFTPQKGVRCGPWSKWGLRKALKKLRGMGYGCERWDNSVLVERIADGETAAHR